MPKGRRRRGTGRLRATLGLMAGAALGVALGLRLHRPKRFASESAGEAAPAGPAAPVVTPDYEYCSRIVWSDDPKRGQGDLEDAESIEALVSGGWELIDVIVPFAQTRQMDMGYPGNTRKLIAYFRRPVRVGGAGHAEELG
jgi:hypothetical protein